MKCRRALSRPPGPTLGSHSPASSLTTDHKRSLLCALARPPYETPSKASSVLKGPVVSLHPYFPDP